MSFEFQIPIGKNSAAIVYKIPLEIFLKARQTAYIGNILVIGIIATLAVKMFDPGGLFMK